MSGRDKARRDARQGAVAVVVPAYNASLTIGRTIASARSQTHDDLDVVAVDDGSTDGTAARADAHARADRRVRIVR